jgi:hypothetical protein
MFQENLITQTASCCFAGYYRRFIKNFSQISKALTDMMPSPQKKSNRKRKHIQKPWNWGDDQEKAFNKVFFNPIKN